tara:strand:+ start:81 stop:374 length:294 start_codon:yes stop_codon:yes gene_type:complete
MWSYNKTKLLREQYGKIPAVAIAALVDKTPDSIRQKARSLGLKSNLYHRVKIPLNTIINFRARGYSARKIGRLIGYSHTSVLYAEKYHHIKKRDTTQ